MVKNISTDVTIIGAGLTGITTAILLAQHNVDVAVIEYADIKNLQSKESDGRTCAVSYGSSKIFDRLGLWEDLKKKAQPILDIRVSDGESPLFVHYDHKMVGSLPMGYIIENSYIRNVLFKKASEYKNLRIIDKTKYQDVELEKNKAAITLDSGQKISSMLIIAADGKHSNIRKSANIKSTSYDYKQTGIVCTVKHEKHHNAVAVEKFLPTGPFAILPMHGGYHSSLVWTEPTELAPVYMKMTDSEFIEQIAIRFAGYLGKIELASNRFSYPLSLNLAKSYTSTRLALVGDAAHGIHPIAGQGFNLGIRDVSVLEDLIGNAKKTGQDIGSDMVLEEYAKTRKFDSISLIATTDILTRLFSNNIIPVKHARRIGLATVNKITPLKKFFMRHAMGDF
ncbi:MAG: 2-octaprenyl-6-methoxyphenyl hydroxylase [Rickettsiales bacterium]|nr:2-octaprenyl-6-methoxyphenyl hydroxylase [Pseudomonadota bacterium]MDA0965384.1 2-octaprenyl-6-methoxyphenyl hydroxylase [Pseudomonadota bacterium]MDG4544312.1 2-octaprenyl-6-methoxyphenyl hydroxylase [Rickettsiales bacterium]MDG4544843.1 2-octaprenyl-6-methoxyphenyl hydroxylase [Rickettsiales bacterium]MDG4546965.1 2-octaprenyl-6-methoxyphenyl hydroxylase [Rickettsiales bacterium]